MYETNVAKKLNQSDRAPIEQLARPAFNPRMKKPNVSANLSAGMLENNRMKRPKGAIDFFLSLAGHSLLVAIALLLPLYFSDAIDLHQMETTYLVAPPLPPPPPAPAVVHSVRHPTSFFAHDKLYAPRVIPNHIAQVKDIASLSQPMAGMPGGVIGGVPGGQLGGVIGGILGNMGHVLPPPPMPKPPAHRGPYRVGWKVRPPEQILQVQPIYPILAKEVRVQGPVVIDSVIDTHLAMSRK
jgi:protein TonB